MPGMSFGLQVAVLFVLAIPIACVAWTITHEEIFREPREWCVSRSKTCRSLVERKFFYLFTCEYCFSHYVTIGFLVMTRFRLWLDDWRGYVLAGFALVFIANVYMSLFGDLRLEIRQDRQEIATNDELAELRHRRTLDPSWRPPSPPSPPSQTHPS
jgi:hypothetical protein